VPPKALRLDGPKLGSASLPVVIQACGGPKIMGQVSQLKTTIDHLT
jgi:hypothetical protein